MTGVSFIFSLFMSVHTVPATGTKPRVWFKRAAASCTKFRSTAAGYTAVFLSLLLGKMTNNKQCNKPYYYYYY
jgi:hypothetical protein